MPKSYENRSAWLQAFFLAVLQPFLAKRGYDVISRFAGKVRFNGAFPSKGSLAKNMRRLVEIWEPSDSHDGHAEVNISQTVDDTFTAASLMAHAAVQLIVGKAAGTGKEFRAAAVAAGLTSTSGRNRLDRTDPGTGSTKRSETWTITQPAADFERVIRAALRDFPPYPAKALDPKLQERKANSLRITFTCPEKGCPVTFKSTRKAAGIDAKHSAVRFVPFCGNTDHDKPVRMAVKIETPETPAVPAEPTEVAPVPAAA